MALSDGDWNRLDRMRKEDRDHLDAATEKLDSDSLRQWKAIARLDKDLEVHKSQSETTHQQPCAAASLVMKEHIDKSLTHNPKALIPLVGALIGLASTAGAWLTKVLHVKSEVKP